MSKILIALIRLYQYTLSAVLGNQCRFYPSCSAYFIEALETHGALKGCTLGVNRICRCHPWHPGGCDPVPPQDAVPVDPSKQQKTIQDSGI
jgi:uncharacterized protein